MASISPAPLATSRILPLDRFAMKGNVGFIVPKVLSSVDEAFVTKVLRGQNLLAPDNEVTGMDSKIIGADRGFTSNVMLAKISYKTPPDPGTAPEKLVIKIMGADLKVRGIVDTWIVHNLIFPNEVRFFSECNVSDCEAEFPLNYFSYSRGTDHLMMMEDVGGKGVCGDGAGGGASKDQVRGVMMWLGRLHGRFWGRRADADSPSSVQNIFAGSDLKVYPILLKKVMPTGIAVFRKAFPHIMERIGEDTFRLLEKRWKAIARIYRSEPLTLCHGDMKLDNLFFKPDHSVIAVDWGVSGWGNPMADLSYFFGRSVEAADRREYWDEMLDLYYSELTRVNPSLKETYTREKMLQDLSYTCLVPFFTICGTLKGMKHAVMEGTGPFAPKGQRSKDDDFKRTWMEDSLVRCAEFINDMKIKGSLESNLIKVDPSFPVIPCCCFWTM